MASGNVGPQRGYACYAVGWYVENAEQWTAHYIKTTVPPAADGWFRTSVLQMGSDAETTSAWYPFVIGGISGSCAWLQQLWAQSPTGQYRAAWPPVGITVLYSATAAIHRTT